MSARPRPSWYAAASEPLLSLPAEPYPATLTVDRVVSAACLVACRGNQYAVLPGLVATEAVLGMPEAVRERVLAQLPAERMVEPQEIAAVVAFLASEEAGYITGANISVNGGMHMM